MFPPPKSFSGVNINFAQNFFYQGSTDGKAVLSPGEGNDKIAVTEAREGSNRSPSEMSLGKELRQRAAWMAQAMRARGVKKGDRGAVAASNSVDTITVFLGVTALGGRFSSSSADMGVRGILLRLLQIKPTYLFFDDWALYNGKKVDLRQKMREVVEGMKGIGEFKSIVSQPARVRHASRCFESADRTHPRDILVRCTIFRTYLRASRLLRSLPDRLLFRDHWDTEMYSA